MFILLVGQHVLGVFWMYPPRSAFALFQLHFSGHMFICVCVFCSVPWYPPQEKRRQSLGQKSHRLPCRSCARPASGCSFCDCAGSWCRLGFRNIRARVGADTETPAEDCFQFGRVFFQGTHKLVAFRLASLQSHQTRNISHQKQTHPYNNLHLIKPFFSIADPGKKTTSKIIGAYLLYGDPKNGGLSKPGQSKRSRLRSKPGLLDFDHNTFLRVFANSVAACGACGVQKLEKCGSPFSVFMPMGLEV